jgi:uncharacterized protein YdeI (BOF family)
MRCVLSLDLVFLTAAGASAEVTTVAAARALEASTWVMMGGQVVR